MKLKNETYDLLKFLVTRVLPSLTTLWLAIASIWNIPLGEPIGATIGAVTIFIGALIDKSSKNYYKGELHDEDE